MIGGMLSVDFVDPHEGKPTKQTVFASSAFPSPGLPAEGIDGMLALETREQRRREEA